MHSSLKILVVDDEPDLAPLIRQKFRRQIREGSLEFVIAGDGVEALERLEEFPDIDVVLTDLNMPRMDGLTFLSKMAEAGGIRKAVVVTAVSRWTSVTMLKYHGVSLIKNRRVPQWQAEQAETSAELLERLSRRD